uniref:DUF29 domain-containing protein n=1 Tax=Candidatus Kentrum sp. FM TaxID=2126340 RepID=A0A450SWM5_9GAMM|nr:MAG: protein of unknown function DUF29 [Candidatus Kentron sp. FM]VFJ76472.1 MAG: protein of unknown function DUF29 [Candidatus Kentron sp. FM]VFK18169.1 MAG: protein of unknown function DUF29 [Candidatus Kentron sp. FM]
MALLYESDFYAWTNQQAALLRAGDFSRIDIENIVEEIEGMGRRERRELVNRLKILLVHLLKWQYQPAFRGRSWTLTIKEQRKELELHLSDNPSLKSSISQSMKDAYELAVIRAKNETGLESFPKVCPYGFHEVMDGEFWPK